MDSRAPGDGRRASGASSASQNSLASQRGIPHRHSVAPGSEKRTEAPKPAPTGETSRQHPPLRLPAQLFNDIVSSKSTESGLESGDGKTASRESSLWAQPQQSGADNSSIKSTASSLGDGAGLVTHRFKHVLTKEGHAIVTGRDGDILQRCEDEPIHIPGAVQGFGMLIALKEEPGGNLPVRIVSENSKRLIGRSPRELFALESFTDILSEEQADNLLDHIDFIKDEDSDVGTNGPEVFTMAVKIPGARSRKLWCAVHMNEANPGLIICEFELEDDQMYPLVPPNDMTPELPEDTLDSNPTSEEFLESTQISSRPLRVLRSARKRKGEGKSRPLGSADLRILVAPCGHDSLTS